MLLIITVIAIYLVLAFILNRYQMKVQGKAANIAFTVIFIGIFAAKLYITHFYTNHNTDMDYFSQWADRLYKNGLSEFYADGEFSDYPPVYMYILYVIGMLRSFGLTSPAIINLPAILCDSLNGLLLFYVCRKENSRCRPYLLLLIYALNPVLALNSTFWGQVDSVITFFILLTLILIEQKKLMLSYFVFAAALLTKPQAAMIAPVIIFATAEGILSHGKPVIRLAQYSAAAAAAIAFMLALTLPFGTDRVIMQYIETLASYPYASVNALNLWALIGQNYQPLTNTMSIIGYTMLPVVVAAAAIAFFRNKAPSRYFSSAVILIFGAVMLCVKMHERYSYPAVILTLFTYVLSARKTDFLLYLGLSASQCINTAYLMYLSFRFGEIHLNPVFTVIVSMLNMLLLVYMLYISCVKSTKKVRKPLSC